jgi:hypothetical protein
MNQATIEGGCLCGKIRYAVASPALQTTICHCLDCRKASGAPFVAWTFFRSNAQLSWTCGFPRTLIHADRERTFCGDCGTPLKFYDPNIPDWFEMNTCTLDDPSPHQPADECWLTDRIPWTARLADLPKFDEHAPLPGS